MLIESIIFYKGLIGYGKVVEVQEVDFSINFGLACLMVHFLGNLDLWLWRIYYGFRYC